MKQSTTAWLLPFWLLAACTNHGLSPHDTLTVELEAPTQTINPLYTMDTNSQHVNELVHASLVVISPRLVPEPYLAEEFHYEGKNSLYFRLRRGCRFANGKEITSADVGKSIAFYLDPGNESAFAKTVFERIRKFERIDDYRFRLITEKPAPSLLTNLELLKILQLDGIEPGTKPTSIPGAGPYKLAAFTPTEIRLERVAPGCLAFPAIPKISIKVVREDISRYLKLRQGELDLVLNDMNYRKVELILKDPSLPMRAIVADGTTYGYMGVNLQSERLRDPRVRRALALSFDIPTLIRYKSRGMALPARNMLADMNFYANKEVPLVTRNLPEARRLLDEAGYSNGSNGKPPLRLTLKTSSNMINTENARVLVAQAREAGILLEHRPYDWGIYFADVKSGNTELYTLSWAGVGISDPHLYFELFHSSQIGRNNRTRYNNPEMDRLIDLGESSLDPEVRRKYYLQVQKLAAEDLPFLSLYHTKNTAVFRKEIKGVTVHPMGTWRVILGMSKE
jgi:peptide/nickel transport system substrate-binding protein